MIIFANQTLSLTKHVIEGVILKTNKLKGGHNLGLDNPNHFYKRGLIAFLMHQIQQTTKIRTGRTLPTTQEITTIRTKRKDFLLSSSREKL
jgi:hypothetical protein